MRVFASRKVIVISILGLLISSCLNNGSSGSTPSRAQTQKSSELKNPLTLSDVAVVPQISGTGSSHTLYVHNHSNRDIKDISYQVKGITNNLTFSLNETSIKSCNVVRAGSSCALVFNELINSDKSNTGSAIVEAAYKLNDKNLSFSQLIRIERIEPTEGADLVFSSGLNINGYGNSTGHGIMYLYSASSKDKVYNVEDIKLSKPGLEITQGRVKNTPLPSGFVYAIEIKSPIASDSISSEINALLVNRRSINSTISVDGINSKAILTTGLAQLIDISKGTKGSLSIKNSGSSEATLSDILLSTDLNKVVGDNSCEKGSKLLSGQSCVIYFNITSIRVGSGSIKVIYSGGDNKEVSQQISWFDSTPRNDGIPLLQMSSSVTDISVVATQITSPIKITLTNVGSKKLTSVKPAFSTSAHINGKATDGCQELEPSGSCEYYATFTGITEGNGQIQLKVSGLYNDVNNNTKTYERMIMVGYKVSPYAATLVLKVPDKIKIVGNNIESTVESVVILNNGHAPATITFCDFINNKEPAFKVIDPEGCKKVIPANGHYNLFLNLGPRFVHEVPNINGFSTLKVIYSDGSVTEKNVEGNLHYIIEGVGNIDASFKMTGVAVTDDKENGNGSKQRPYVFYGSSGNGKSITFTYSYFGAKEVKFDSIINHKNTDTRVWEIDENVSNCNKIILSNSSTCIIKYNNILASSVREGYVLEGVEKDIKLYAPSLKYSGVNYIIEPKIPGLGDILHVKTKQARITAKAKFIDELKINVIVKVESGGVSYSDELTDNQISFRTKSDLVIAKDGDCDSQGTNFSVVNCNIARAIKTGSLSYAQYFKSHVPKIEISYAVSLTGDRYVAGGYVNNIDLEYNRPGINPEAYIGFDVAQKVIKCSIIKGDIPKIDVDKCRDFFAPNAQTSGIRVMPDKEHLLIATRNPGTIWLCKVNDGNSCKSIYNSSAAFTSISPLVNVKDGYQVYASEFNGIGSPGSFVKLTINPNLQGNEVVRSDRYTSLKTGDGVAITDITYIDQANNKIRIAAKQANLYPLSQLFECFESSINPVCKIYSPSNWLPTTRGPYKLYQFGRGNVTYAITFENGELAKFITNVSWDKPFGDIIRVPDDTIRLPNSITTADIKPNGFGTGIFVVVRDSMQGSASICHFKFDRPLSEHYCVEIKQYPQPSIIEVLS